MDPMPGPCTLTPPLETSGKEVAIYRDWKDAWEVLASKPLPPPPSAQPYEVDAERDRRVELGFEFMGKHYQTREAGDRENILGAMSNALLAIMRGAKEGELRWENPEKDFFWIATDNSRVPMDAQTALAFGQAAMSRKSALVQAGSDLKAMTPIPLDFAADKWWPS
ncbi:DUF4376 domain-containing protein [Pseudomonas oryzihabitans]|uniref:DUF4376 domain-containing protein n=1 Tax=Pseudomonas oryzihabitans TaxID=47885 RepID=A0AAJ2BFZ1_9PSED|nr:DUF4376 domain-containing protein [Pseudomonas psychrotolerans]MDR6233536.1 hypothetical protein [Pseudomonas psychrotolerans]